MKARFPSAAASLFAVLFVACFSYADLFAEDAAEATLVEFTAFDGTTQQYMEYVPPTFDPSKPATLVIALHGHGSDCNQIFAGQYQEFLATIEAAVEHNGVVVSPGYRPTTSWMGPAAERDVVQIIEEQCAKRAYARTIVSGASMGGSSSLTFTVLHPELIDGVVSMNGTANHLEYENFQDAISASYGGSKKEVPEEYKKRSGEYFPEAFLGKPTAITLGSLDTIVPPDSARRLAKTIEKIGGEILLIEREDIAHSTPREEADRAFKFVFEALETRAETK